MISRLNSYDTSINFDLKKWHAGPRHHVLAAPLVHFFGYAATPSGALLSFPVSSDPIKPVASCKKKASPIALLWLRSSSSSSWLQPSAARGLGFNEPLEPVTSFSSSLARRFLAALSVSWHAFCVPARPQSYPTQHCSDPNPSHLRIRVPLILNQPEFEPFSIRSPARRSSAMSFF